MHFGSIITALGSYLQAKSNQGKWLVRIDDVDLARSVLGADTIILKQLESLGLYWDEDIIYQRQCVDLYRSALEKLRSLELTFPCVCKRKMVAGKAYPGTCRKGIKFDQATRSIRIKTDDNKIGVVDRLQGKYEQNLRSEIGDFIIKRADHFFAYHLATVVDDAEQNISEVVRGIDLLKSTPRQVYLQKKLNLMTPSYIHLPIAIDKLGKKISKSGDAEPMILTSPGNILFTALDFLGQQPSEQLIDADVKSILAWAIDNWQLKAVPKEKEIKI